MCQIWLLWSGWGEKGMPYSFWQAKLGFQNFLPLGCQNFDQELGVSSVLALCRSFCGDGNVLSVSALSMVATSHMWQLGTSNVARATEKDIYIYLIHLNSNSHGWLY